MKDLAPSFFEVREGRGLRSTGGRGAGAAQCQLMVAEPQSTVNVSGEEGSGSSC